jgi:hypothetical protein
MTAALRAAPCRVWLGRAVEYQIEAKDVLMDRLGRSLPWVYVVPTCGTRLCLTEDHLRYFRAQRIAYPDYVCIYCGMPGYTKDHLLPVTMTGESQRKFVAVVPACKECNSAIGDRVGHRVTERREEAHRHIRKKYRREIEAKGTWTPSELAQLGPNLRGAVKRLLDKGDVVRQRLEWPWEPDFDRRAFEKSGFEDPIAMDLL